MTRFPIFKLLCNRIHRWTPLPPFPYFWRPAHPYHDMNPFPDVSPLRHPLSSHRTHFLPFMWSINHCHWPSRNLLHTRAHTRTHKHTHTNWPTKRLTVITIFRVAIRARFFEGRPPLAGLLPTKWELGRRYCALLLLTFPSNDIFWSPVTVWRFSYQQGCQQWVLSSHCTTTMQHFIAKPLASSHLIPHWPMYTNYEAPNAADLDTSSSFPLCPFRGGTHPRTRRHRCTRQRIRMHGKQY